MKTFVLALCVALACAETVYLDRQQSREYKTRFEAEKSYLYKYETVVLSDIPQTGQQFHGQKIKSFVNITFMTESINKRAFLQLIEPQLFEVNGTVYPTEFTLIESNMSESWMEQLSNPVEFHYSMGNVTEVIAPSNESDWVMNVKKGILNMFILRLEDSEGSTVFSRFEEGVSGICDTMYQIEKRRNIDEVSVMNITKVRDFTNCTYAPTKVDTRAQTKDCVACEDTKTSSLKSMATFKYNVTGYRTNFLIESVISEGLYIFYPYSIDGGSARTLVNQSLVLVNYTDVTEVIPKMTIDKSFGGIFYTFPKLIKSQGDILPKIDFFLEELKQTVKESMTIDAPSHFIHLVNILRLADFDTLYQIWENYENKINMQKKRECLLEALPLIGTEEVTKLMKMKILDRQINLKEAEKFLTKLTYTKNPTEMMIDNVMDICRTETWNLTLEMSRVEMMEMVRARRACWLTFGNLVGEFCEDYTYCPIKYVNAFEKCNDIYTDIDEPIKSDVFDRLSQKSMWVDGNLKKDNMDEDVVVKRINEIRQTEIRLMCINAIGNAGLPDDEINKVKDTSNRLGIRVAAVHALRKLAPKTPNKILSTLLPIMRDPFTDDELRIVSYLVVIECKPSPTLLVSIAENLKNETSKQFRTFVSTHLMNLAKSQDPCKKRVIKAAKYAIKTTKLYLDGPLYSQNRQVSIFNDDFQAGGTIDINTIFTPGSLLPRSSNTKLNVNFLGKSLDVFEFGYRAEGLTNVLEKMFAPNGFWYKRNNNLMNFLKRSTRSVAQETTEEMIDRKVNPFTIEPESSQGYTWLKVFGQEMTYEAFNKEFFKSILTEGKIRTNFKDLETSLREPQTFNWNKGMLLLDYQRQVPTICGLPLSLNVSMASILSVDGEVMMRVTPTMLSKNPIDIASNIKIKPRMSMNLVSKMGISCPCMSTGVAMNRTMNLTLPVDSEIVYNFEQKKFRLDIENQKNDYLSIFSINNTMYTFSKKMDNQFDQYTIINGSFINEITNTSSCFMPFEGGMQLCSNMTYVPRLGVRKAPFRPFVGYSSWNVYSMRGENSTDRIIFEYEVPTTNTTDDIASRLLTVRTFGGSRPETTFTFDFMLDRTEDKFNLTIERTDIPDWFYNITCKVMNMERSEVNLTMEWGLPKTYSVEITEDKILYPSREFFIMINSVRNVTLRNRTYEIIWADVPMWLQNFTSNVRMNLPFMLSNLRWIEDVDITRIPKLFSTNNTMNITFQAKQERTIDIIMDLPLQRVQIFNMTIPTRSDIIQKRVPMIWEQFQTEVTDKFFYPTCTLNNFNNFTTFDGVNYRYQMPVTCPHVLARDCSPEQLFTILLQNRTMADNTVKKVVTILVEDKKIILDSHDNKTIKIQVDGQDLWINSDNFTNNFTYGTFKMSVNRTEVNITTSVGLTVVYNIENVTTILSPWFYNQTCGMCGDFNGETSYEFVTPENQWTTNSTKFALSWLVPGDGNTDGSCNLIKKYVYPLPDQVFMGNKPALCLSTEPVFTCPENCVPAFLLDITRLSKSVGFNCFETEDREADITKYTKTEKSLYTKRVNLQREVSIPDYCICSTTYNPKRRN